MIRRAREEAAEPPVDGDSPDLEEEYEVHPPLGTIHISDEVLAELAGISCTQCYGVVGMASQSFQEGMAQLLGRDTLKRGVKLKRKGNLVSFNLFIIVEAGINITEVARNLIDQVKYTVGSATGLEVEEVQVHIQGVRAH
jgi:uncharacterized alkaline shock family protein YloU